MNEVQICKRTTSSRQTFEGLLEKIGMNVFSVMLLRTNKYFYNRSKSCDYIISQTKRRLCEIQQLLDRQLQPKYARLHVLSVTHCVTHRCHILTQHMSARRSPQKVVFHHFALLSRVKNRAVKKIYKRPATKYFEVIRLCLKANGNLFRII